MAARIKIIETIPAIPALEYHVAYRQDGLHAVAEIIANGAVRTVAFRYGSCCSGCADDPFHYRTCYGDSRPFLPNEPIWGISDGLAACVRQDSHRSGMKFVLAAQSGYEDRGASR